MRYRVLLVDPVRHRRDRALELLQGHYDIVGARNGAEAQAAIATRKPDAVVLTLRQFEENGLAIGKALRAQLGDDALILVHGDTTPPANATDRSVIAAHHKVNAWLPGSLEAPAIDALVGSALARRFQPRVDRERKSAWARLRQTNRRTIWEFLTRPRHIIPTPYRAPHQPPGWIEILNGPPTLANMRLLVAKVRT